MFIVILAYLIGSIPFGYLYAKYFLGTDIRTIGSGNIGATNIYRAAGIVPAGAIFILDLLKGLTAVMLSKAVYGTASLWVVLAGLAVIAGHNWTVFLKFRGGKGVATSSGVIAALMPLYFLFSLGVFGITFLISRIISISSLIASAFFFLLALFFAPWNIKLFAFMVFLFIFLRHLPNIRRMLEKKEDKIV